MAERKKEKKKQTNKKDKQGRRNWNQTKPKKWSKKYTIKTPNFVAPANYFCQPSSYGSIKIEGT